MRGQGYGFGAFWVWVHAVVQGGNSLQPQDLVSIYNSSGYVRQTVQNIFACKTMVRAVIEKQWIMGSDDEASKNKLIIQQ
ncbi:hypothetical protein EV2_026246 [Malus domestica]|uniref:Uncharacterized protein n=1 Tax=Malus domestica TaxID=3750 RepID=A0A498HGT3_MALDO|nr:hypothetical protein DVH24_031008 [Malus domestica]